MRTCMCRYTWNVPVDHTPHSKAAACSNTNSPVYAWWWHSCPIQPLLQLDTHNREQLPCLLLCKRLWLGAGHLRHLWHMVESCCATNNYSILIVYYSMCWIIQLTYWDKRYHLMISPPVQLCTRRTLVYLGWAMGIQHQVAASLMLTQHSGGSHRRRCWTETQTGQGAYDTVPPAYYMRW